MKAQHFILVFAIALASCNKQKDDVVTPASVDPGNTCTGKSIDHCPSGGHGDGPFSDPGTIPSAKALTIELPDDPQPASVWSYEAPSSSERR